MIVGLAALFIYSILTAFDPKYDQAEIKQTIGGTLICKSVYTADHHSWQYDISYKYKRGNNPLIDIGSGTYYGRDWNKDEQLVQYKDWLLLKTGGWHGTDKVIVGSLTTKPWKQYEFSPETIEKDSLRRQAKIHSLLNWCCAESFIDQIKDGQIIVHYKFRTSEKRVKEYGQRRLFYALNELTGQPTLTKVE